MIIYTYSVYFESMIKYKKTYEVNIILEHIQCLHKPILKYSRFLDVLKQGNAYLLSLHTGVSVYHTQSYKIYKEYIQLVVAQAVDTRLALLVL